MSDDSLDKEIASYAQALLGVSKEDTEAFRTVATALRQVVDDKVATGMGAHGAYFSFSIAGTWYRVDMHKIPEPTVVNIGQVGDNPVT
jgi:hypothetical protein